MASSSTSKSTRPRVHRINPGDEVQPARLIFFRMILKHMPELFCKLRDEVFPLYSQWTRESYPAATAGAPSYLYLEDAAPFVAKAISDWAMLHHLIGLKEGPPYGIAGEYWEAFNRQRALWPCQMTAEILRDWWLEPDLIRGSVPKLANYCTLDFEWVFKQSLRPIGSIQLDENEWYPKIEDERVFRRRILVAMRQWLDGHIAEVNRLEGNAGKRSRKRLSILIEHIEWLAQFQAAGKPLQELAKEKHATPATVYSGISHAAQAIGLKLLKNKSGRKRKLL
jgi:hypothetical protein